LDIVTHTVNSTHLAQQVGAAISELGYKMPELMSGVGHRQGLGTIGDTITSQNLDPLRTLQGIWIQSQIPRQFHIYLHKARGSYQRWIHPCIEAFRQMRIGISELETNCERIGVKDCGASNLGNIL
jgi:hypothetical protein